MRTYKFDKATIYVHGEIDKERLRKATVKLVKDRRKGRIHKEVRR